MTDQVFDTPLLPASLAREIQSLNESQRTAVLSMSDGVTLAGPGAGKTRFLVAKAAYLTIKDVRPPHRIACITYGTQAAEEISQRLRALYPGSIPTVVCATVHGFCLAEILTPFSAVAGFTPAASLRLIGDEQQAEVRQRAYDQAGLSEDPKWRVNRDIACRRSLYAGESPRFESTVIAANKAYERLLIESDLLDFEAMVGRSLEILRSRPAILRAAAARHRWLLVDEYQDLGPVLHAIVMILRSAGVRICAVGDPDQAIYGFTGSDPRYLRELASDPSFHVNRLRINYRSGRVLVDTAAAILGEDRGYEAHSSRDSGVLNYQPVPGGINSHAAHTANLVHALTQSGIAAHEIAILYTRNRRKWPVRDWLTAALDSAGIQFSAGRAQPWPRARIVRFLQSAASWQLSCRNNTSAVEVRFDDLADQYSNLLTTSSHRRRIRLAGRVVLWEALWPRIEGNQSLSQWISNLDNEIGLGKVLRDGVDTRDSSAFRILGRTEPDGPTVGEFAGDAALNEKVIVSTYHAAKGKEWSYVLLPFLQEGLVPDWPLDFGRPTPPTPTWLREERRLFYVAVTRAKTAAVLIYSPSTSDRAMSQFDFHRTPSRFIIDLPGFPKVYSWANDVNCSRSRVWR